MALYKSSLHKQEERVTGNNNLVVGTHHDLVYAKRESGFTRRIHKIRK